MTTFFTLEKNQATPAFAMVPGDRLFIDRPAKKTLPVVNPHVTLYTGDRHGNLTKWGSPYEEWKKTLQRPPAVQTCCFQPLPAHSQDCDRRLDALMDKIFPEEAGLERDLPGHDDGGAAALRFAQREA